MRTFAQEMAELTALVEKGIALFHQASTASVERQAEIRAELEGINRECPSMVKRIGIIAASGESPKIDDWLPDDAV